MEKPDIQKIIAESPSKLCKCGCEYFDNVTVQKEVSALRSGTGKQEILLVGVLICHKCGERDEPSKIIH
jgi:hypothetical protein